MLVMMGDFLKLKADKEKVGKRNTDGDCQQVV
jgi:hypothetical protein